MAFRKFAKAAVVKPDINFAGWDEVREKAFASPAGRLAADMRSSKIVLTEFQPKDFLLTHITIIASVDTEQSPAPLGKQMVDGFQIDRKYPDWLITPETSKYVNNNCFVPGTMILMADGTEKPIELVVVGDQVVTHTGAIRPVTETFIHPFKGYLRSIYRLGDPRTLDCTPEHPFFAMTPATTCACGCGTALNRRARKAAVHRFQDYVRGHGAKLRKNAKPDYTWVSAGLLDKGDFLSMPRLQGEVTPVGVTPGRARLLGYYLAEGFYHRQKSHRAAQKYRDAFAATDGSSFPVAVDFALNLDETDTLVQEIRQLLMTEFGVGSSVAKVSENGVTVHSHQSVELVQFFQEHATEYAKTKRLAAHVLQWPTALQREVVQGWIEGDGCVQSTAGGWVTVTSASSDLISQMHSILGRLGVFATRGVSRTVGRKRLREANGGVRIVDDPTKVCVSHRLQIGSVHAEALLGGSFLEPLFKRSTRNRRKQTLGFRVSDQRMMFPIRSVAKKAYEGRVYNFETDIDHSYVANGVAVHNSDAWERKLLLACYKTFVGGENYVEHIQIPEMSKGKIIDAAARDIGESVYVDLLIATNRRHRPLIAAITSQQLNSLSMGCQVSATTCTKCGNVAEDETQLCTHIRHFKGNTWIDDFGKKRIIAELCGHITDEPGSVKFIEASWVANPAFTGAVLRSILSAEEQEMAGVGQKMAIAFSEAPRIPAFDRMSKAAFTRKAQDQDAPDPMESGAPDPGAAPAEKAEPDAVSKAVGDLVDLIREKAIEKVRGEINKDESGPVDENRNDSLIKSALKHPTWTRIARTVIASVGGNPTAAKKLLLGMVLYRSGGWKSVTASKAFTGRELLALSRLLDTAQGSRRVAGEGRIYGVIVAVGGLSRDADVQKYLGRCHEVMGRDLTDSERVALVTKGRLFALGL